MCFDFLIFEFIFIFGIFRKQQQHFLTKWFTEDMTSQTWKALSENCDGGSLVGSLISTRI